MESLEEALNIAREIGDSEKLCTLLINLGVTEGERGNHQKAEIYFQEALQYARQIGHREWMSLLYSNLGDAESEMGDYVKAETYFQEGLNVAREIDQREWISVLLNSLGQMTRKQGHYDLAETYLQESLLIAKQINRPQIISEALYAYGDLHIDCKQASTAEKNFREMLNFIPEGSQDLIALAHFGLSRASAAQGRIEEALKFGESSLTILESVGHRSVKEVKQWIHFLSG